MNVLLLNKKSYYLLALTLLSIWLLFWLSHFPYLYGWQADDWAGYRKAQATVSDWTAAFTVRANLMQPFFFLYSYLPILFNWTVPSFENPIYGQFTGNFRFLIFQNIVFHGSMFMLWIWFVTKLCQSYWICLGSLVFFLTLPNINLWVSGLETRLVGLPFVLLAIYLIWEKRDSWRCLFAAGFLLWLAQSLHYTALYLIVPFLLIDTGYELLLHKPRHRVLKNAVLILCGIIAPIVILEAVSFWGVLRPLSKGPTASLIMQNKGLRSPFNFLEDLNIWRLYFEKSWGVPLCIFLLIGIAFSLWSQSVNKEKLHKLCLICLLGSGYAVTRGGWPFFRMIAPLVPFIGLLALIGFEHLLKRSRSLMIVFPLVFLACLIQPVFGTIEVANTLGGYGRLFYFLNSPEMSAKKVIWYIPRVNKFSLQELIEWYGGDSVIVTEDLAEHFIRSPGDARLFAAVKPIWSHDTVWNSQAVWSEHFFYSGVDFTKEKFTGQISVYRSKDILQALTKAQPLRVTTVQADSVLEPTGPRGVFDHDLPLRMRSYWHSEINPKGHWLDINFDREYDLDQLIIVLPIWLGERVSQVKIVSIDQAGRENPVWSKDKLESFHLINATWDSIKANRLKIYFSPQTHYPFPVKGEHSSPFAVKVVEIYFLGYHVELSGTALELDPLLVDGVKPWSPYLPALALPEPNDFHYFDVYDSRLVAIQGKNFSDHTVAELNGRKYPTRLEPLTGQLVAMVPFAAEICANSFDLVQLRLVEPLRQSSSFAVECNTIIDQKDLS